MNTQTVSGALGYRIETGAADIAELGLRFPVSISRTAWETCGRRLGKQQRSLPWTIGDWAFFGEGKFRSSYDEMCELTGLEYQTIANYVSVAGRFEIYRRRENLSFSHHAEVVSMGSDIEQDEWLDKALEEGWSSKDLRAAIKEATLSEGSGEVVGAPRPDEGRTEGFDSPPSESAVLHSTLESMRNGITVEHARLLLPRLEEEGISAERWVERLLDEVLMV